MIMMVSETDEEGNGEDDYTNDSRVCNINNNNTDNNNSSNDENRNSIKYFDNINN